MKYKLIYVDTKETQLQQLIGEKLDIIQDENYTYLLFENNKYVKVETKRKEDLICNLVTLEDSHSLFVLELM